MYFYLYTYIYPFNHFPVSQSFTKPLVEESLCWLIIVSQNKLSPCYCSPCLQLCGLTPLIMSFSQEYKWVLPIKKGLIHIRTFLISSLSMSMKDENKIKTMSLNSYKRYLLRIVSPLRMLLMEHQGYLQWTLPSIPMRTPQPPLWRRRSWDRPCWAPCLDSHESLEAWEMFPPGHHCRCACVCVFLLL